MLAIALILTSVLAAPLLRGDDPPANLAKLVAHRETETQTERNEYTYRQTVTLDELDSSGGVRGQYQAKCATSSSHRSTNAPSSRWGSAQSSLKNLILTEEDFHDIREIQPLVLTEELLWNYETKNRGEENIDGVDCWVMQVRPRQILEGQRFFDGMLWVDQKEYNIVRMQGQAVPQMRSMKSENLFPRFTTIRKPIDGKHWFPIYTYADDTLQFRTGPQRERLRISYSDYKRFGAESTFTVK